MSAPRTETIAVRFTEHEHNLLEGLAELRGMSAGDVVRELVGFECQQPAWRLDLSPQGEGGGRR